MDKVTLTLTLTKPEAISVLNFLNTSPESISKPTSDEKVSDNKVVVQPIKTPQEPSKPFPITTEKPIKATGIKTGIKMASFGRTPEQIKSFEAKELARKDELDEEEELKTQRREEREAKKAERDKELQDKKDEEARKAKEVEAIKSSELKKPDTTSMPRKPWDK